MRQRTTTRRRTRTLVAGAVTAAAAVALAVPGHLPSGAQIAPIAVEELTDQARGAFTDDVDVRIRRKLSDGPREVMALTDPSHLAALRIVVQPGATFPWHTHPGPVLVTVTRGMLVYVQADDCVERAYPAGTSFVDPGNRIHTAYAPGDAAETELLGVILDAPVEGPLTIPDPTTADEIAALDERCGIDTDTFDGQR